MTATTFPAFANSVDVKVTGTITPDACTATVSNNGTFDYGAISVKDLSATGYTFLGKK
ncbi:DUF1120 domain-containing protein [Enterobacter cloacae]|uniref:DUF1120 domain-containing protein n=1 Tax=Enterobacter cloacae TaxID=550 RepID=UPI002003935D|nr:DUF1120 domain-containing protein [Enterobacter cloacae]MCK7177133.1 DUF1120 domain-containing protein [Enterobacter cloacae]